MFKKFFLAIACATLGAATMVPAQQSQTASAAGAQSSSPVAPQPKIKSQKELQAIQAMMNAADPNSRIEAANKFVEEFPDSEFKAFGLQVATLSYQMLNDYDNLMIYGERTLEADPNSYGVLLAMANALAQRTREFDLDKEEKLGRATEYANKALEILEKAPRPNANVTDAQWEKAKSDLRAQAHEALGLVALDRKDYEKAVTELKLAVDLATSSNEGTKVRLGAAYNGVGNYGEAIATLDAVLAKQNLHPAIRRVAEAEKAKAVKLQEAKKK